jgi:hypothetical protein
MALFTATYDSAKDYARASVASWYLRW